MSTLRNDLIKLAYEKPHLRDVVFGLLRTAADAGVKEEEKAETPSKKRKGPPPKWDEFLKAKYNGGKKKVSNPNSKTRAKFPQVSASTAMKDKAFFKRVLEEYKRWIKSTDKKPAKSKATPTPKTDQKSDLKKSNFKLPPERLTNKKIYVATDKYDYNGEGEWVDDPTETIELTQASKNPSKKFTLTDVLDLAGATSSNLFSTVNISADTDTIYFRSKPSSGVGNMIRDIVYDGDGKYHIHNDTLMLPEGAPKGLGTRLFANQVAKARDLGNITHIECEAFRSDPTWVGYKVWPKMGYDGTIPQLALNRLYMKSNKGGPELIERLKAIGSGGPATKVSDFYKVEGGEKWWEENGASFNAVFDLTPGSHSLEIHDKYVAKKAKEAGQTVEEFMSKIAAKSKKKPTDDDKAKDKPGKGKGDNITLDESDHKILDEIWKSMRK